MNMRPYLRLSFCAIILFSLLFSACRNEPQLPNNPWDNTVKVRIGGDPENLGYLYATGSSSIQILRQIFLPFADFDPGTTELVPLLAKSLPITTEITEGENAGLVSYEFEIRPEATWADGSPVTGADYLFTLKAIYNPVKRSIYAGQFRRIKKVIIDKDNPKKFTIYSDPYVMAGPSYSNVSPLPSYLFDPEKVMENYSLTELREDETLKDKADLKALSEAMNSPKYLRDPSILQGSGPYQLTEWTTGQQLTLTKRANWWGDEIGQKERLLKAIPQQIIFKIIPDLNAAISLMKNDEVDIIGSMDWTSFLNEKKNADFGKKVNFYTPDVFALRMMNFNTTKEKLSDKKTRRAIAHLFDFEEINNTIWYGFSKPISSPVYPTKPSYNKDLSLIGFNMDKAKTLLKEAGWEDTNGNGIVDKNINGETVELDLDLAFATANPDYVSVATIFASTAKEAGVNIIPRGMESSAYLEVLKSKNFDMTFSGIRDYPFNMDPANKWHSRGRLNYSAFGTPESDALIVELRKTVDVDKQNELTKQLQAIIYDEQPGIFIGVDKDRIMAHKKFGQISTYGLSPGFNVNEFDGNATIPVTSSNN